VVNSKRNGPCPFCSACPCMHSRNLDSVINSAREVVERWDAPLWKDIPATAIYIGRLRAALLSIGVTCGGNYSAPCSECGGDRDQDDDQRCKLCHKTARIPDTPRS